VGHKCQLITWSQRILCIPSYHLGFEKNCVRICIMYFSEFAVSKKKGPLICVTLIAHHMPTLILSTLPVSVQDFLMTNTCYFAYLCDHPNETIHHPRKKLSVD
jgi:hypothetical protein